MKKSIQTTRSRLTHLSVYGLCFLWLLTLSSPVQPTEQKSLLWKIKKEGIDSPSYVFGTLHVIEESRFFFPDYMKACLTQCETLVTEILTDIPIKEQIAIAQRIILPDNKTYKDFLSEDDYAGLKSYLIDSLGLKENKFNAYTRIKPAYFSGLILNEMLKKPTAYEKELTKIAKKESLELFALETIEEQLAIMEAFSDSLGFAYFSSFDLDLMSEYSKMLEAYLNQDIAGLYQSMQEDDSFKGFEAELLTDRNFRWTPVLDSLIQNKSCFIAVGAGHLPGEKGLLNILKNEGYIVSPVLEN